MYQTKDVTLESGMHMRYYEWPSSGPEIVMLHGSSGYALMFEQTAELLSADFHVYIPDQRGHGDSDRPDGNYAAEEFARDANLFMKAVGLDKAIIAGHSNGGRAAQVFAAEYPEKCVAAILIGGPHLSNFYLTRENAEHVLQAVSNMSNTPSSFPNRQAALEYLRKTRAGRDTDETLEHRIDHNMNQNADGSLVFKYDPVRVAQGLTHMTDDLRGYAPRVTCPVAILRSTQGGEFASPDVAVEVAKFWTNAPVTIVAVDGGYLMHVVAPEATASAITTFVREKVGLVQA